MISIVYITFFAAQILLCSSATANIDPNTLRDVFGYGSTYNPIGAVATETYRQVVAVTPYNETLVDPDYWDLDEFHPSAANFDKFDWTLTKRVAAVSGDNFLISPLGLKLALAILTEAATGNTKLELSSVLGFALDRREVRIKFSTIIDSLKKQNPEYVLNLGSRIYIGDYVLPRQRFAAIAEEFYKTEIRGIDFYNPPEASKQINAWVSNITHGKIPDLVDDDDVSGVVAIILNALYFKGSWRHQFPTNATKSAPFFVTPDLQKPVLFMNIKEKFYFTESANFDAKILRMPYRGNKFAMFIIVPNSLTGLSRIMNGLSDLHLEMNNLQERTVDVTMPKFQFDYTSKLESVLKELGIRQAFEETASFPGLARGQLLHQRLRVSKIVQKSGIEVNEIGSIAHSATEIGIVNKFGEDDENDYEVVVNKPFLFFIQDEYTKQLLFTGRVSDPSIVDGDYKVL